MGECRNLCACITLLAHPLQFKDGARENGAFNPSFPEKRR